eukprot:201317-Ditylum_brightwellii.AAC.1
MEDSAGKEDEQNSDEAGAEIVNEWKWEEIPDDLVIPDISDHYNGPKDLKDSVEQKFNTTLDCIFETREMDIDFLEE